MTVKCNDCGNEAETFFEFNSAKNVLMMTGSPILNRPQDLWAQLNLIDPVNYSSERQFLRTYCYQDWYTKKWSFNPGGLERLVKQISSKFVKRDRESAGIKVPPQEIMNHDLTLDPEVYPEQYKVLQGLNRHATIILDSERAVSVLYMIALITRKRQATVYPEGIELKDPDGQVVYKVDCQESIKLDFLIKPNGELGSFSTPTGLIPDLGKERIVVFSQFKSPLKELERRLSLAGYQVGRYDGDTPESIRQELQLDFDRKTMGDEPKYQIMLCNYKTGGVGLNFTGATQVIILDREWSPGKEGQALGRVDRIGQTEETTVHVIRVKNSIDTWLDALINQKKDMIDGFESEVDLAQSLRDHIENGGL